MSKGPKGSSGGHRLRNNTLSTGHHTGTLARPGTSSSSGQGRSGKPSDGGGSGQKSSGGASSGEKSSGSK